MENKLVLESKMLIGSVETLASKLAGIVTFLSCVELI